MLELSSELRTVLVLLSMLCLSQLVHPVYSVVNIDTGVPPPRQFSQVQSLVPETVSTINISVNAPEYIPIEKIVEIRLLITNTGMTHRGITVRVESLFQYIEIVYPKHDLVLKVPPEEVHVLNILVRGVSEGEEVLVITVTDPLANQTYVEILRLPVTTLRTIYIHAHGVINLFTLEIARRPIRLYSVKLCNISASHLGDNVYMVEIPKIYRKCPLRYEYFFTDESFEVSLVEDTIHLTTIDTESNLSITIIAIILLIPTAFIISLSIAGPGDGDIHFTVTGMSFAIVSGFAISVPSLFIHLGFGLAILIFDLIVILGKLGFFHLVYYLLVLVAHLIRYALVLFVKAVRQTALEVRRRTKSPKGTGAVADDHLELIKTIKKYKLPSPPERRHVESVAVPVWLRNYLKRVGMELPNEMHLIDCGYLGCVYECGPYAIKLPRTLKEYLKFSEVSLTISHDLAIKFMTEASIVNKLDHGNILRLIDYSANLPILVYELAEGNLQMYKQLELKDILAVAIQLCEGLKYLHSRGIVHGDIKPSNILVVKGVIKLGDLSSITHLLGISTESVKIYCTPGYCAPEQLFSDIRFNERRKGYENRVDVYQLANVILYMLGVEPIDAKDLSPMEVDRRLENVKIRELQSLLRNMLSPYPWLRPSIDEVEKELLYIWKKYIQR